MVLFRCSSERQRNLPSSEPLLFLFDINMKFDILNAPQSDVKRLLFSDSFFVLCENCIVALYNKSSFADDLKVVLS
ncbi:hypothetical protein T01_8896 [Trichinella spiralis]|uniref:Uncharacterized protein n=1 Tax=Trichinella spiralis TaxID=6334 RepID=A0A0V1BV58_TRISP|nr:hypothetical protein T01_8896 [Trichinella spiralis]